MPKTTREILVEARQLITPPENWSGPATHAHVSECYCAATAIWNAADEGDHPWGSTSSVEAVPAGDALAKAVGIVPPSETDDPICYTGDWRHIYHWNDHTTHENVLAAFDQAIGAQS